MKPHTLSLTIVTIIASVLVPSAASAGELSAEAEKGKTYFSACLACHDETRNPPLGPPMYGVKNRYMKMTRDKSEFVAAVTSFTAAPDESKVQMREAFSKLGLMPAMPLPEEMLNSIATYMFETTFPPPCTHWKIVVEEAEKTGNVDNHILREKQKIQRFCQG